MAVHDIQIFKKLIKASAMSYTNENETTPNGKSDKKKLIKNVMQFRLHDAALWNEQSKMYRLKLLKKRFIFFCEIKVR